MSLPNYVRKAEQKRESERSKAEEGFNTPLKALKMESLGVENGFLPRARKWRVKSKKTNYLLPKT